MVAAECIFSDVEGDDVDIGLLVVDAVFSAELDAVACLVGA
jgi:hypothetical protein